MINGGLRISYELRAAAMAALLASTLGCGGNGSTGAGPNSGPPPGDSPGKLLSTPQSCEELFEALVLDASNKIEVQAEQLLDQERSGRDVVPFSGPPIPNELSPSPEVDVGEGGLTDTNVQVAGVDEADTVETDAGRIYLLQGNQLITLDAEPASSLATRSTFVIEGTPLSMFVEGGRGVVFSSLWTYEGRLALDRICRTLGPALPEALIELDDGGTGACPTLLTKATVLDLSGDEPVVVREIAFEGTFAGARRHGDIVRLSVSGDLGLPASTGHFWDFYYAGTEPRDDDDFAAVVDQWKAETIAEFENSTLDDWLPKGFERANEWQELALDCQRVSVPEPGLTGHGTSRLVSFDMTDAAGAISDALVLGSAGRIYANRDFVLLAQEDWGWQARGDEQDRTALRLFRISEGELDLNYVASAFVPGTPHDQFSFDIQDDVLRISTTVRIRRDGGEGWWDTQSVNRVGTLRIGPDSLETLGSTSDLAPDERIFATRFLGDWGYLVTFRQIDPLFVIDLSDPANPVMRGELELPGFSDYIHPLDDDHLLTVGQAGDAAGNIDGVAVRVFDIADPTDPRLRVEFVPSGSSWSIASQDHHAFTFRATDGLLALPIQNRLPRWSSGLDLFEIGTSEIAALGRVEHDWGPENPCGPSPCRSSPSMLRGLLGDDIVYSISVAAVEAHDLGDLSEPIAQVYLPDPWVGIPPPVAILD